MPDLITPALAATDLQSASTASWFVVHTKPRQENVAQAQLLRQEFEVYLPLFRVFRKPRRAPRTAGATITGSTRSGESVTKAKSDQTTAEPMFPRYLFVRPTRVTQSLSAVRSTVGVAKLVAFGQQPAMLADGVVQAIMVAEAARNAATLDEISPYKPGMHVHLLDPAFAGLEALVQSVSRDRVTLLLEILGRPQSVQVRFEKVSFGQR